MIEANRRNCKSFNVLFTCIGRRVSLLNSFRAAAKELGLSCKFFGTDVTSQSAALQLCDKSFVVKSVDHNGYIRQLLRIVRQNNVALIVPTIDLDLYDLATYREKFEKLGCRVLVSSPQVVKICQDKRKAYRFMTKNGFETPQTLAARQVLSKRTIAFPMFLKPWDGYASKGNAIAANRKELLFYARKIPNCIVQEFVKGEEYTCDCFVDFDRKIRCVVPRKRIEVRSGEVSKGVTVKNRSIMSKTAELVEMLGAGPGIITVQLIYTKDRRIKFIEINPRVGGGLPLSIKAGADFPKWVLAAVSGVDAQIRFDGFKSRLTMLRYDAEVWVQG